MSLESLEWYHLCRPLSLFEALLWEFGSSLTYEESLGHYRLPLSPLGLLPFPFHSIALGKEPIS